MAAVRSIYEVPRPDVGRLLLPLSGSLAATSLVAAFVCELPSSPLRSWPQLVSRAVVYLTVVAAVHGMVVWSICKMHREEQDARWPLIWKVIWGAWIAVVWLPLLSLLTRERSAWIAFFLPATVVFALLFLKWQRMGEDVGAENDGWQIRGWLQVNETPALLRVLWPALFSALMVEVGAGLLAAEHAWWAGCCFAAGAVYPFERTWQGLVGRYDEDRVRASNRTSALNTVVALLLTVLALVPFLRTSYVASLMEAVLGSHRVGSMAKAVKRHGAAQRKAGYEGVILLTPPKPHALIVPVKQTSAVMFGQTHEIDFDGAYFYFQQPNTSPGREAHTVRADPTKRRIWSVDQTPLVMEAHQRLGSSIAMSCCRSLRVHVKNADTVSGMLTLEVWLRDAATKRSTQISLGAKVLPTSVVDPMPLDRAPVEDTLTFQIPRADSVKSFNEIVVRIQPGAKMSLAGPQVAIESFSLHP